MILLLRHAWQPPQRAPAEGRSVFLPVIRQQPRRQHACAPVPGAAYQALAPNPPPTDRPAEPHADLNLALRGYAPTSAFLGLVDYGGGSDTARPTACRPLRRSPHPRLPQRLPRLRLELGLQLPRQSAWPGPMSPWPAWPPRPARSSRCRRRATRSPRPRLHGARALRHQPSA